MTGKKAATPIYDYSKPLVITGNETSEQIVASIGRRLSENVPHYKCHHCFDRGHIRLRKVRANGDPHGQWLHVDCQHCNGGKQQERR